MKKKILFIIFALVLFSSIVLRPNQQKNILSPSTPTSLSNTAHGKKANAELAYITDEQIDGTHLPTDINTPATVKTSNTNPTDISDNGNSLGIPRLEGKFKIQSTKNFNLTYCDNVKFINNIDGPDSLVMNDINIKPGGGFLAGGTGTDGGYIAYGNTYNVNDITISKTNISDIKYVLDNGSISGDGGKTVPYNSTSSSTQYNGKAISKDSNSSQILTDSSSNKIFKLNSNKTIAWQQSIYNNTPAFQPSWYSDGRIFPVSTGYISLGGGGEWYLGSWHFSILKRNTSGVVQWQKEVSSNGSYFYPLNVLEDGSGNYYIIGDFDRVIKINSSGTVLGNYLMNQYIDYENIIKLSDGNFLTYTSYEKSETINSIPRTVTYLRFLKINKSNFNVIDAIDYGPFYKNDTAFGPDADLSIKSIKSISDNEFLFSGYIYDDAATSYGFIGHINFNDPSSTSNCTYTHTTVPPLFTAGYNYTLDNGTASPATSTDLTTFNFGQTFITPALLPLAKSNSLFFTLPPKAFYSPEIYRFDYPGVGSIDFNITNSSPPVITKGAHPSVFDPTTLVINSSGSRYQLVVSNLPNTPNNGNDYGFFKLSFYQITDLAGAVNSGSNLYSVRNMNCLTSPPPLNYGCFFTDYFTLDIFSGPDPDHGVGATVYNDILIQKFTPPPIGTLVIYLPPKTLFTPKELIYNGTTYAFNIATTTFTPSGKVSAVMENTGIYSRYAITISNINQTAVNPYDYKLTFVKGSFASFPSVLSQTTQAIISNTTLNIDQLGAAITDNGCSTLGSKKYVCFVTRLVFSTTQMNPGEENKVYLKQVAPLKGVFIESGNIGSDSSVAGNIYLSDNAIVIAKTTIGGSVISTKKIPNLTVDQTKLLDKVVLTGTPTIALDPNNTQWFLNSSNDNFSNSTANTFSSPPEGKLWQINGPFSTGDKTIHGRGTVYVNGNLTINGQIVCADSSSQVGIFVNGTITFSAGSGTNCGTLYSIGNVDMKALTNGGNFKSNIITNGTISFPNITVMSGSINIDSDKKFMSNPTVLFKEIVDIANIESY